MATRPRLTPPKFLGGRLMGNERAGYYATRPSGLLPYAYLWQKGGAWFVEVRMPTHKTARATSQQAANAAQRHLVKMAKTILTMAGSTP